MPLSDQVPESNRVNVLKTDRGWTAWVADGERHICFEGETPRHAIEVLLTKLQAQRWEWKA